MTSGTTDRMYLGRMDMYLDIELIECICGPGTRLSGPGAQTSEPGILNYEARRHPAANSVPIFNLHNITTYIHCVPPPHLCVWYNITPYMYSYYAIKRWSTCRPIPACTCLCIDMYVSIHICMSVIPTQVSMHEHVFLMSVCMCRSQEIHNHQHP